MAEHTGKLHGVVKGITQDWGTKKGMYALEIEEPPTAEQKAQHQKMKGKGDVSPGLPSGSSTRHPVPVEVAQQFAVGDPVEVETTIRHFGKRAEKPATKGQED